MNPEVKTKWLEALRSGNYFQGKEHLKVESGGVTRHCCLGVLCEVAIADGLDLDVKKVNQTYEFDTAAASLPIVVQDWSGILSGLGDFYNTGVATNLAFLNDRGQSFASIADVIEEKF